MAQFDVHWLDESYVLDCQSDLIDLFGTRLVVPLLPSESGPGPLKRLTPQFDIRGERHTMATPLAAAGPGNVLRHPVLSLAEHRYSIQAALDMLLSGY